MIEVELEVQPAEIDLDVELGMRVSAADEHYEGEYTITPTQEAQTLSTAGLLMDGNVVINPIPSNYGLITYNGAVLTVS